MIINPLIYSGMDHFWLKQPRESIEFSSRFFHSKLFNCLNSMNFRGHTSSSKNLKQKSHQACTVWKKFGIYLLQCVKTCDFLFFSFSIPHDLILFFSLIHFLNNLPFLILNISLGKIASSSQLHPPHVPVLKALLYATAFANLYFHPTQFSFFTKSFTDTHISSSFQGSDVFCSGNVKFMHRL